MGKSFSREESHGILSINDKMDEFQGKNRTILPVSAKLHVAAAY